MRRRAVIAGCGAALLAAAGCAFVRPGGRDCAAPSPAQSARHQELSELAQADHCSQPTATTTVQRLEQRGWVRRAADPDDSRAVRITVTDAGRAELETNRRTAGEQLAVRMARLGPEQRVALAAGVRALHDLIEDKHEYKEHE